MILVCGGAGYIGSQVVRDLFRQGRPVLVADDLSTGHRAAIPADVPFFQLDLRDGAGLEALIRRHQVRAVMHFAAASLVAESMIKPLEYFDRNVGGFLTLLKALAAVGEVKQLIVSSSAAVYGRPLAAGALTEAETPRPINPYGETKLMMERALAWTAPAQNTAWAALRYFNAAGAEADGRHGEDHRPETHLIPLALRAAQGRREALDIFGTDYDTPDGTAVRDYISVQDLAEAHLQALEYLERGGESDLFNLGGGGGHSVREVAAAAERVTGRRLPLRFQPRRPGDPPRLVADISRARDRLGWRPRRSGLDQIITDAWVWHQKHPDGYES